MHFNTWAYGPVEVDAQPLYGGSRSGTIYVVTNTIAVVSRENGGEDFICEGHLLVPRWERGNVTPQLRYAHYRSIFDAVRAAVYTLDEYGNFEVGEISHVLEYIEMADWLIIILVGYGALPKSVKLRIRRRLAALELALERKSDPHKAASREHVKNASTLTDVHGRQNIGRSRLLLAQARIRLETRYTNISSIKPSVAGRKEVVVHEYHTHAGILWSVRNGLGEIMDSTCFAQGKATDLESAQMRRTLEFMVRKLSGLRVEPFLALKLLTIGDLNHAQALIHLGMFPKARGALMRAYNGVRTKLAAIWLEKVHIEVGLLVRESVSSRGKRDETPRERVAGYKIRVKEIAADLEDFSSKLGMLDDTRFIRPIFKDVRKLLAHAIDQLQAGFFTEAKATVKTVSEKL